MAPQCSLVREIDFLVFPPKSFYLQVLSTQTTAGGWGALTSRLRGLSCVANTSRLALAATLLIPLLMGAIFAVIWVQNDAIPDVSQSFSRDLKQLGALQLQIDCTTRDALGNANPFCPGRGAGSAAIPPPAGFQFVPTISDTACQHSIVRAANRSLSQTWLSESNAPESYSSPAIVAVETALGIPESSIAGAGDPFQLVRLATLAKDMSIVPQVRRPGCQRE